METAIESTQDLRTKRKALNLRHKDIAPGMLTEVAVVRIEQGQAFPSARSRRKIEAMIGKVDWFATFTQGIDTGHPVYEVLTEYIEKAPMKTDREARIRDLKRYLSALKDLKHFVNAYETLLVKE